jgi:DNA polymerase-4
MSLDEAFLDVSGPDRDVGQVRNLAQDLKSGVRGRTGLILSVGGASSKSVAKIASDLDKPDGLLIVPAGEERAFLAPLPVRRLWGVGPRLEAQLKAAGIEFIGQLANLEPERAEAHFGSRGSLLVDLARGIDSRGVSLSHERKSVGAERTFPRDLEDGPALREMLAGLVQRVAEHLEKESRSARTVSIKLRFNNFETISRQTRPPQPVASAQQVGEVATLLLDRLELGRRKLRLIGVQCSDFASGEEPQLPLWRL